MGCIPNPDYHSGIGLVQIEFAHSLVKNDHFNMHLQIHSHQLCCFSRNLFLPQSHQVNTEEKIVTWKKRESLVETQGTCTCTCIECAYTLYTYSVPFVTCHVIVFMPLTNPRSPRAGLAVHKMPYCPLSGLILHDIPLHLTFVLDHVRKCTCKKDFS